MLQRFLAATFSCFPFYAFPFSPCKSPFAYTAYCVRHFAFALFLGPQPPRLLLCLFFSFPRGKLCRVIWLHVSISMRRPGWTVPLIPTPLLPPPPPPRRSLRNSRVNLMASSPISRPACLNTVRVALFLFFGFFFFLLAGRILLGFAVRTGRPSGGSAAVVPHLLLCPSLLPLFHRFSTFFFDPSCVGLGFFFFFFLCVFFCLCDSLISRCSSFKLLFPLFIVAEFRPTT